MLSEFVEQALIPQQDVPAMIGRLASEVAQLPQLEPVIDHSFAPGVYIRSCIVPAGAVVVGKKHLHDHVSFVDGDITVYSKDGHTRITGARMLYATAGVQRAVYAHADTIWRTVHANPTDERDLGRLEAALIEPALLEVAP
jgi:hypothetical protein